MQCLRASAYGLSYRYYFRRVARYVDAVLKGAKPADLLVEQPTTIELVVNLRTAQAVDRARLLGLIAA